MRSIPAAVTVTTIVGAVALIAAIALGALIAPIDSEAGRVLVGLAAALASAAFGAPTTRIALAIADPRQREGDRGGILVATSAAAVRAESSAPPVPAKREILRGGLMIGVVERALLTAAITAGYPEAVAAIVAVKAIGRFGELTEPEARERFIVGSLVSLGIGALWGLAAVLLTR